MDKNNLLYIGKIVNTFGINGDLKLNLDKDLQIVDLIKFNLIFLENGQKNLLPFKITDSRIDKKNIIIHLENLNNINDVVNLKDTNAYFNNKNNCFEKMITIEDYSFKLDGNEITVIDYLFNGIYDLVKVSLHNIEFWVPLVEKYIDSRDDLNLSITLKNIEELK